MDTPQSFTAVCYTVNHNFDFMFAPVDDITRRTDDPKR